MFDFNYKVLNNLLSQISDITAMSIFSGGGQMYYLLGHPYINRKILVTDVTDMKRWGLHYTEESM